MPGKGACLVDHVYRAVTPDRVTIEYALAGIGSRALAAIIDTLVIVIFDAIWTAGLIYIGSHVNHALTANVGSPNFIFGLYFLVIFLFTLSYYILFEALWNGKTPGKWLIKLRVINHDGRAITFFGSLVRNIVRIIDLLPTGYLIGMIFMLITKREQRLGDLAAGTIVVFDRKPVSVVKTKRKKRHKPGAKDSTENGQVSGCDQWVSPEAMRFARITSVDDQNLVQSLLERLPTLSSARSEHLANQIVDKLCAALPAHELALSAYAKSQPALVFLKMLHTVWLSGDGAHA